MIINYLRIHKAVVSVGNAYFSPVFLASGIEHFKSAYVAKSARFNFAQRRRKIDSSERSASRKSKRSDRSESFGKRDSFKRSITFKNTVFYRIRAGGITGKSKRLKRRTIQKSISFNFRVARNRYFFESSTFYKRVTGDIFKR